jgi:hypothetical protein
MHNIYIMLGDVPSKAIDETRRVKEITDCKKRSKKLGGHSLYPLIIRGGG